MRSTRSYLSMDDGGGKPRWGVLIMSDELSEAKDRLLDDLGGER